MLFVVYCVYVCVYAVCLCVCECVCIFFIRPIACAACLCAFCDMLCRPNPHTDGQPRTDVQQINVGWDACQYPGVMIDRVSNHITCLSISNKTFKHSKQTYVK